MRILICGIEGYIGWPLALKLKSLGHTLMGIDNGSRSELVKQIGSESLTPIQGRVGRISMLGNHYLAENLHHNIHTWISSVRAFEPECIVHLAEQPSAPWSMRGQLSCTATHTNNIFSTLNLLWYIINYNPSCHLVKLGTMGEYGTPPIDIPEGFFEITYRGREARLPFPKQPNSWYHLTKVHDTNNILFACRNYDIRSTDIMQGIVFGVRTPEMTDDNLLTRFDYDQYFGTAINRFCVQAIIEDSITIYGTGGQTRGFIPLKDSIECLTLAIESPPERGEYRVFNQFAESYSIGGLGAIVEYQAAELDLKPKVVAIRNPRKESEDHYYNPDCNGLRELGYDPKLDINDDIRQLLTDLLPFRDRVRKEVLLPTTKWDNRK